MSSPSLGATGAAPKNLGRFLDVLRAEGLLAVIEAPVSARLEVAEIHRRTIAAGGPALLFTRVEGACMPLVTNLFGTARRVELAFGPRPEELIANLARLPEEFMPPSLAGLWKRRGLFSSLARVGLKQRATGAVTEICERKPKLRDLPALQSWPRDGGPFLTLPLVYTEHPETGVHNLGMYRAQIFDDRTCGAHIQIQRGAGFHLAAAEAAGRDLPVNLMLGGPPALILSAIAPLPENVPELLLASLMLGSRLEMTDNPVGPLPLVAEADLALVGRIKAHKRRPEGPFGDHYGYYSEIHDFPVFEVDALLKKHDAVFPATVVGKPRQEDFFIGDYLQRLLSPLFPLVMPAVSDLWSSGETGYHSLSAVRVKERYKREAMVSAFRVLGEGQLSLTKFLLAVDGGPDLKDFRALLVHVLERAVFETDLFLFPNLSMDTLDYAGPRLNEGSKGVLLGLGEKRRELPTEFTGRPSSRVQKVFVFAPGCLVIEGPSFAADAAAGCDIARDPAFADWPLLVLSDNAERAVRSTMNFLWTTFTRFDPARDLCAAQSELIHNHAALSAPILIDARMKPNYPEELVGDEETAHTVGSRWQEYFPGGGVEMGPGEEGHLD